VTDRRRACRSLPEGSGGLLDVRLQPRRCGDDSQVRVRRSTNERLTDMNKTKKKLTLTSETVRDLRTGELAKIEGGRINLTRASQCECPTFMCDYTAGGCTF
jgi:hypothetical protein